MMLKVLRNAAIVLIGILLSAVVYGFATNNFTANSDATSYSITLQESTPRTAFVEANFKLQDSILFLGHEGPDPMLFGQFVKNLRVTDQDGTELQVRPCAQWWLFGCNTWKGWERGSKWLVDAGPGDSVAVNYEIDISHANVDFPGGIDSAAFVTDWGNFFTGRSLFIMNGQSQSPFVSAHMSWMEGAIVPVEDSRQNIEVSFELPEGWHATVPWTQVEGAAETYVARDLIDLAESMLFVGTHHEVTTRQGETEIGWAFGGEEVLAEKEKLSAAASDFFDYYVELMDGVPKTARGETFPKVVVIINSGDLSDGEVINRHLNMIFEYGSDIYALNELEFGDNVFLVSPIHLVAHEFFHLWNGKTIDAAAEGEWLTEGLTEYYSMRAVRQLGFIDEATSFALLSESYLLFVTYSGFGTLSIQSAGEDKGSHRGLIYGGGMFVGMALDLVIRHETQNQKSYDDLMRILYAEYAGQGKIFSSADVKTLAEDLSGIELAGFFDNYVYGTEVIPLEEYLQYAGLDAVIIDSQLEITRSTDVTSLEDEIYAGIFGSSE